MGYFSFFAAPLALLGLTALVGCGSGSEVEFDPGTAVHPSFSGEKAFAEVEKFVAVGPHPPGTEASKQYIQHLEETLRGHGWEPKLQSFPDRTPRGEIQFTNVRARFPRKLGAPADWERGDHVILGSHFDTKYYDTITFVGANDGGSSTGALLEIARCLAARPALASRIELVFFDGEEAYVNFTPTDGLYGSRYYTGVLRKTDHEQWPRAMVLVDLIGDRKLNIRVAPNGSSELLGHLYAAAKDLGTRKYFGMARHPITDDHVPFNHLRIPAINIIDLDYEHWHRASDTLDKISPESLEIVGQTTLLMVEKYLFAEPE